MSYYLGANTDTVKPITRRTTWTRKKFPRQRIKFLMRPGRRPKNQQGFPVGGQPVSLMPRTLPAVLNRPGTSPEETEEAIWLGTPLPLDMGLEPGQQLGGIMDAFKVPTLTTTFRPTIPTTVVTPAPSSWWDPLTSAFKDVSVRFDPFRALQRVVSPGQVESAVEKMRRLGLDPMYKGVPLTGQQAGWGYRLAGIDWAGWMPWIIGGGAALFILPMMMKKRR